MQTSKEYKTCWLSTIAGFLAFHILHLFLSPVLTLDNLVAPIRNLCTSENLIFFDTFRGALAVQLHFDCEILNLMSDSQKILDDILLIAKSDYWDHFTLTLSGDAGMDSHSAEEVASSCSSFVCNFVTRPAGVKSATSLLKFLSASLLLLASWEALWACKQWAYL